jgi:hypothetical protein
MSAREGQCGPMALIVRCRALAMTPYRSPRSPELQRSPRTEIDCFTRESMDKEEEREAEAVLKALKAPQPVRAYPKPLVFQCRLLAMTR